MQKTLIYDDVSKNFHVKDFTSYSKSYFAFLKIFKLLSMWAKFQVSQQQFSIPKNSMKLPSSSTPLRQPL